MMKKFNIVGIFFFLLIAGAMMSSADNSYVWTRPVCVLQNVYSNCSFNYSYSAYSWINTTTTVYTALNMNASGNITAGEYFIGDGSLLTGIVGITDTKWTLDGVFINNVSDVATFNLSEMNVSNDARYYQKAEIDTIGEMETIWSISNIYEADNDNDTLFGVCDNETWVRNVELGNYANMTNLIGNCSDANCNIGWGNLTGVFGSNNISIDGGVIAINDSFSIGAHTTDTNCTVDGDCPLITYDSELAYIGNCTDDGDCPLITYDSELAYIGNCSGKDCTIGWGNLTSIPADIADGDADTTINNCSVDQSCDLVAYQTDLGNYLNITQIDDESELEGVLTDVTDVYTDNDNASLQKIKPTNASYCDDSSLLGGQLGSYYLDGAGGISVLTTRGGARMCAILASSSWLGYKRWP